MCIRVGKRLESIFGRESVAFLMSSCVESIVSFAAVPLIPSNWRGNKMFSDLDWWGAKSIELSLLLLSGWAGLFLTFSGVVDSGSS